MKMAEPRSDNNESNQSIKEFNMPNHTHSTTVNSVSTIDLRIWGVHAMDDSLFRNSSVVAIGWDEMGDLSTIPNDRESFKQKYAQVYPEASTGNVNTCSGMIYRFVYEMQIGDIVVYPSKADKQVYIGRVEGDYKHVPSRNDFKNERKVKWIKHVPRTSFSNGALYEIGSALTLFLIKNYAEEFLATLTPGFHAQPFIESDESDSDDDGATYDSILEQTRAYVLKELRTKYKGYDLEPVVANLLEAMGYSTVVSRRGGDRGLDIKAFKGEYQVPPRIIVQCKSQDDDISEDLVQRLKGTMKDGDYGLFVALSKFRKNALDYLSQNPIIRGIDGDEFVELFMKHYDKLNAEIRKEIPLKMVYVAAPQR